MQTVEYFKWIDEDPICYEFDYDTDGYDTDDDGEPGSDPDPTDTLPATQLGLPKNKNRHHEQPTIDPIINAAGIQLRTIKAHFTEPPEFLRYGCSSASNSARSKLHYLQRPSSHPGSTTRLRRH